MLGEAVNVITASVVAPYTLAVTFDDGHQSIVDFGPFLHNSRHPSIREYLDPARFAAYIIKDGDLMWGDYDLIFHLEELYAGSIS